MAVFIGDARSTLERARNAERMPDKIMALEAAVAELIEELTAVLTTLGPENFSELGRKAMRED